MMRLSHFIPLLLLPCSLTAQAPQAPTAVTLPTAITTGTLKGMVREWDLQATSMEVVEIDGMVRSEAALVDAIAKAAACTVSPAPTDLTGLTDGFDVFSYSMSASSAAKIGIPFTNIAGAGDKRVFVHDFMFYKNGSDSCGNPLKYGAGVRVIITAQSLNANVALTSLAAVAASTEFRFAESQYRIQTIGMSGPLIDAAAPSAGPYDIEKHVALMKAVDMVRAAARDASTKVTPAVVNIDIREDEVYVEALARVMGLRAMAAGKTCNDAKRTLANGRNAAADVAVEAVYKELVGSCGNARLTDVVAIARLQVVFRDSGWR